MTDLTFYSEDGSPVAYTEDGEHIFSFDGEPLAFIDGNSIFNFDGEHLGWFKDRWVFDHDGERVFFTEKASGGPRTPRKQRKPMKSMKQFKPVKGSRSVRPTKPRWSRNWSKLSSLAFFNQ